MSSLFGIAGNGASEFYTTKIDQSLRFNDNDNAYLKKTYSGAGNTKTWTWSGWIKRANLNVRQQIFGQLDISVTNRQNYAYFHEDGHIWFVNYTTSGYNYRLITSQVFRDTANWYHLVFVQDTTQSTSSDRLKIYVNGTQITSYSTASYPSLNFDGWINQNTGQGIQFGVGKVVPYASNDQPLDGYMAEVNFIDGTALTPSSFGETKNGVWIPKAISGLTYGTNGFRFTFADSSSLGDDTSGNGNDFTTNGLTSTDVVLDSPTNNFATFNVLTGHSATIMSQGSLRALANNSSNVLESQSSTIGVTSGKWYAEFRADDLVNDGQNNGTQIGVTTVPFNRGSGNQNGYIVGNTRVNLDQNTGAYLGVDQNITQNNIGTYADGDIIGVALDVDNSQVSFYKNGSAITNATNASITVQNALHFFEIQVRKYSGDTSQITANFGQDSTFAGATSAGGNTDGNGVGDFKYSVPSGYLALCSANLPDTDLSPNQVEQADDYFNTVLYSGDGNTTQNVTGVGFQPDWTWLKERSSTSGNVMADTNRGYDKFLVPNDSVVEGTGILNSVLSDGFQTTNSGASNQSGQTYVSWNWKINGGTTSTDNNGSLTSTVQTNSEVGISIATFNVPTQANFSFGHGLGSVPEMFWWKSRTNTQNWIVYHPSKTTSVPGSPGLYLNNSLAGFATGGSWITELSSTRIAITDGKVSSGSNRDNVVYSFKSVEGFSKIGFYTGNGNANGPFVYTGFRPAWVIVKRINAAGHWLIFDNKRNGFNPDLKELKADDQAAETDFDRADLVSNGFKHRTDFTDNNGSGSTYVYMAFAEQPFKFSNAR